MGEAGETPWPRGAHTGGAWPVSYTHLMIDGVSYVFVYEDELKEMMERVDAGKDPKGPDTMGLSDGSSSTIGDLRCV